MVFVRDRDYEKLIFSKAIISLQHKLGFHLNFPMLQNYANKRESNNWGDRVCRLKFGGTIWGNWLDMR